VTDHLWPGCPATGIGSLPGTDIAEAQRVVLGELPDLPHLPELPGRGPGAEVIGRGAGLLAALPVELYAARWRIAGRPGRDLRRSRDLLERDLDQLTEQAAGYEGPLKVQAAGPWTLAAGIELPVGGVMLRDHGAARDLAGSLAEGLRAHVAEVAARVPGARVLLQLDEPSLPAVLAGRVPSESGWGTLRAVDRGTAVAALASVVRAAGVPVVVHCCAPGVPIGILRDAGAAAVALDLDLVTDLDPLGEAIDAGLVLFAGAVPTGPGAPSPPSSAGAAERVLGLWRKLGFPVARLAEQVVVTPACGLAGASPAGARAALAAARDAGRRLLDAARE
jgi:hypothetical protein